ncbi:YkvA family protein [Proteocatella sphenisci]|uniref:YkvA family protein n=1 Tax=Proteocatella sphenisci TaxID=181070 RepID=UPI0004B09E94|nr:YkvA family protein [Proteocatella sphenisci]
MKTKDRFSKKGKMLNYIKNLKYLGTFLSSNEVGFTKKVEVIFLIVMMSIYLISPIDLVPDFIPVFGYMEDALVVFSMLSYAGNIISKYKFLIKPESEKVKGRIKKERDVIDVEFTEVKEDADKKEDE